MKLLKKLGDGGAVEAFLAADAHAHFVVQVSRASLSEAWLGRLFERSTDAVTAPPHAELLSSTSVQFHHGRFVAFSEPVTGWTGADFLARTGPLPHDLVLDWALSVCDALQQLHQRGQFHGCLAPRHLHLSGTPEFPTAKLFDTALLHLRAKDSVPAPATACVVEPHYLSPERATGSRGASWSDVWGVGALLSELLLGRAPFRGRDADESRALARRSRLPPLPAALSKWKPVLEGCLEPLPVNRFGSVLEVRQALVALV